MGKAGGAAESGGGGAGSEACGDGVPEDPDARSGLGGGGGCTSRIGNAFPFGGGGGNVASVPVTVHGSLGAGGGGGSCLPMI